MTHWELMERRTLQPWQRFLDIIFGAFQVEGDIFLMYCWWGSSPDDAGSTISLTKQTKCRSLCDLFAALSLHMSVHVPTPTRMVSRLSFLMTSPLWIPLPDLAAMLPPMRGRRYLPISLHSADTASTLFALSTNYISLQAVPLTLDPFKDFRSIG